MHDIPPLGWVAIAVILLITLAVNAWMITLLRRRQDARPDQRPGAENRPNSFEVLRDPFGPGNRQLRELSKRVHDIRQSPAGETEQTEKDTQGPS